MSRDQEHHAILREIGQKIQECRALADRLDGGYLLNRQFDKLLERVIERWGAVERATAGAEKP